MSKWVYRWNIQYIRVLRCLVVSPVSHTRFLDEFLWMVAGG